MRTGFSWIKMEISLRKKGQINNMSRTYNGMRQDDGTKWDCELVSVNASRNRAALCMAQYGMPNFSFSLLKSFKNN